MRYKYSKSMNGPFEHISEICVISCLTVELSIAIFNIAFHYISLTSDRLIVGEIPLLLYPMYTNILETIYKLITLYKVCVHIIKYV